MQRIFVLLAFVCLLSTAGAGVLSSEKDRQGNKDGKAGQTVRIDTLRFHGYVVSINVNSRSLSVEGS